MLKKQLLFFQLLITIFICYFFLKDNYHLPIKLNNGYVDNFVVNKGDTLTFTLNFNVKFIKKNIFLYDAKGFIVDSIECSKRIQNSHNKNWNNDSGFLYELKFKVPERFNSGIYSLDNEIYFIVYDKSLYYDLKIIFPYTQHQVENYIATSYANDIELFDTLIFEKNIKFNDITKSFIPFVFDQFKDKKIGVVLDIDLEKSDYFFNCKLLVFYDKYPYMSVNSLKNLEKFIDRGGHIMLLTSELATSISHSPINRSIIGQNFFKDNTINLEIFGMSNNSIENQKNALRYPQYNGIKVINKSNVLLNEIELYNNSYFILNTTQSVVIPIKDIVNSVPQLDLELIKFSKGEVIGLNAKKNTIPHSYTGITILQKKHHSGFVLNLGTNNWCTNKSLNDSVNAKMISNSIKELLKSNVNLF
jgi:hypothetical protein